MSLIYKDHSAGINGDFEVTQEGYPVNWFFASRSTLEKRAYEVSLDSTNSKAGKQSLKFTVHSIDTNRGFHHNAGMFNSMSVQPGETYKISFWIKNSGCYFYIKVNSQEHPKEHDEMIVQSKEDIADWQYFEYSYTIPPEFVHFGFYVSLNNPGTFWIDDLVIEGPNSTIEIR